MKEFFIISTLFGSMVLFAHIAYLMGKGAWEAYCDYKFAKEMEAYLAKRRKELKALSDEFNVLTDATFDLGVEVDKLRFGDEE